MRFVISLSPKEVARLKVRCDRDGVTMVEALQHAIATYLEHSIVIDGPQSRSNAFGLWKNRPGTTSGGVEYQRALRTEWNR